MSTKEKGWSEDKLAMLTEGGGELNWIEREVAWLAELARVDLPDDDDVVVIDGDNVADGGLIDWNYVRRRCSEDLHKVIKSKEAAGLQWSRNKKQSLVRQSKSTYFDQYRQLLRKALDRGYRPPGWESRKDACSGGIESPSPLAKTPQKKKKAKTTAGTPAPARSTRTRSTSRSSKNPRPKSSQAAKSIPRVAMACARPIFNAGDEVMAAWFDNEEGASWYGGKILSYVTIQTDRTYGERRAYTIKYVDGDVSKEPLEDTWIFSKEDYDLNREEYDEERELKGIDNVLLEDSTDPYARARGYYTTKLTGDKKFVSLVNAMRAYDKEVCRQKGDFVRSNELNLPDEGM